VVEATAPPALSPGLLVQLGLLGLVYTYRHPALGAAERESQGDPRVQGEVDLKSQGDQRDPI